MMRRKLLHRIEVDGATSHIMREVCGTTSRIMVDVDVTTVRMMKEVVKYFES